ncbi:MAG: Phycobilisome rod-core linker polypeptide CpcG [Synechococcus sp. CC9902]|nr:MAG: Phycobilisome rod-core linker polypeptide CpcG [Synechococcus sp. CC9902]
MAIPLLGYSLTTQNGRVSNLAGDSSTVQLQNYGSSAAGDDSARSTMDTVIEQAYRQVFFHAMSCDRDPFLESQLRSGNITVRDFIRGLLLSERFQQGYYQVSTNYRMVDQVVGRVLGRPVHGDAERRAWSIVIAENGFTSFIDAILDSSEYMNCFGYDQVPEQRSRVLPGRAIGETPIYQQFPRYGDDWRDSLQERAPSPQSAVSTLETSNAWENGQVPAFALKLWLGLTVVGSIEIVRVLLTIGLSMLRS